MIQVTYNKDGIRVEVGVISKYNENTPFTLNIKKHVSSEIQWSTILSDNWYATYPNTEMFDIELRDSKNKIVYTKKWDVMEHGNHFYKSLWIYNKSLISNGKFPKGLVIGTHDGEFGEWVPIVLKNECQVVLVEASDKQFGVLNKNYGNRSLVTLVNDLVTPNGGEVEFFEGGEGYTNTVVEDVIRHWETEEIKSTKRDSISITDLILEKCEGQIDWLHLDVEGLDSQLIMGINTEKVSLPNFIIFEDYNLSQDKKNEIYGWLFNQGYEIYSEGGICEAVKN
jgi:FkbM family methyltransferase